MRASSRKRSPEDPGPPAPPAACPPHDHPLAAFVESYVDWREESAALEDAYQRWAGSADPEREMAFSAYHAALDREEKAAAVYGSAARKIAARAGQ
jgi:hypothetical protein